MTLYLIIGVVFSLISFGFGKEFKDERIFVDEVGLEGNVGLPYILGFGVSYSLKFREASFYPSLALRVGTGPIVKIEGLAGLNYRKETNLFYSINFGQSWGETFVFDTHGGEADELTGMVFNFQRKKYIGRSKYWCFSQVVGLDYMKQLDASKTPEFYLFPYFEVGFIFMVI
jgi:hypothetical protein